MDEQRVLLGPIIERTSLYEKIVSHFRQAVNEGKLRPGDRLPSERELAALLQVSRTSLREAMKILASTGVVSIRHGQGIFVAETAGNPAAFHLERSLAGRDTVREEIREARELLEPALAAAAAQRADAAQKKALVELAQSGLHLSDMPSLIAHNLRFHSAVGEASGNAVLTSTVKSYLPIALRHGPPASPALVARCHAEHLSIADAIRRGDPTAARRAMRHNLHTERASEGQQAGRG